MRPGKKKIQSWDLSPECLYAMFMVSLMGKTAMIQYGEEPRYRETPVGAMMEHNHAALRGIQSRTNPAAVQRGSESHKSVLYFNK